MPLSFPAGPSLNQTYTYSGKTWKWNGTGWVIQQGGSSFQPLLISGTNLKTVNSTSLLGSGDLAVQPTLVSGTNIKTINSTSLLGSGDIALSFNSPLANKGDIFTHTGVVDAALTPPAGGGTKNFVEFDAAEAVGLKWTQFTDVGYNLVKLTNPSAVRWIRLNADNTVSVRTAAETLADIGAQASLVSGTNIKTVNSTSLLGTGDVAVQPTLVSGTNIKTVNGTSLLGSGNVSVSSTVSRAITITFDNNGSALTTGDTGIYWVCPYAGTITGWSLTASASGSCVIDVWKAAGSIPVNGNSIAGTEKPTLSSQQINSDDTLSTWTTAITAGDVFGFEVESATATKVVLTIKVTS